MIKNSDSNESLKTVSRAFLFDVDGVISDPAAKKITTPGLTEAIAERINLGEIVTLNTGRSISWLLEKNIIGSIEKLVKDKSLLSDIMAVGEKGGTWLTFNEDGKWKTEVDETIRIPKELQNEIKNLIKNGYFEDNGEKERFSKSMFYDESKLTMISTEMQDHYPIPEYNKSQKHLNSAIEKILKTDKYKNLDLVMDPTIVATDIQNRHVGKHLGARRIKTWLTEKGIQPEHFVAIGDSQSDSEMAEELQDSHSVDFVFVGDPNKFNREKLKCNVVITDKKFGEGTLEYLSSL